MVKAIFEDELYDFGIKLGGRETIKTKFGKIKAIRLEPVMPKDQDLFDGENSIRFWMSDDENRIPLKIEADMFVGAVEIDIKDYKNLSHPINFK